jgi:hypothetical protein
MRAAIHIFPVLIIAVLLRYARDAAAWSSLSTIAESVEYKPLTHQYRVSAPEVLQAVSKASHQLRSEAIDDATQAFARLRRQAIKLVLQAIKVVFHNHALVILGQLEHRRCAILRRVQHTHRFHYHHSPAIRPLPYTNQLTCAPPDNAARAAFATFTQRPLLSLVGDRAYIAVGSDAWASAARAFPGVEARLKPYFGVI